MMKNMLKNWKTTLSGVALVITGISMYINNPASSTEAITAILGGIGLIVAKDGDKTGIVA